jgi:hypothetical protein
VLAWPPATGEPRLPTERVFPPTHTPAAVSSYLGTTREWRKAAARWTGYHHFFRWPQRPRLRLLSWRRVAPPRALPPPQPPDAVGGENATSRMLEEDSEGWREDFGRRWFGVE